MVDAAAWAGASAVKLQAIAAEELVSATCPAPAHVRAASLRDFFATFELDAQAHSALARRARERGLAVLATPFAERLVGMLAGVGMDAYKIASGDLTFDSLIAAAAGTGRPLVLSTGMSTLAEVQRAVGVAEHAGACEVAALHCVSAYPTPPASRNLRAVTTLAGALGIPVGLSDHGSGTSTAIAAVALGACLYERHLVLDDDGEAVDRAVSSTPAELRWLIRAMDETRESLGDGRKVPQPAEVVNVRPSRRGLYAVRSLRAGARVAREDVAVLRPATTLPPSDLPLLVGGLLMRDVPAGAPFETGDVAQERAS
jgi:sialic acid synthase SpsE